MSNGDGNDRKTNDAHTYEVGYGKPPRDSRFRKGVSGNPRGRPKGRVNLKTEFLDEMKQKVRIQEGDKVQIVTKSRAAIKALYNKAMKGDVRALNLILEQYHRFDGNEQPDGADAVLSREDMEMLGSLSRRYKSRNGA
jgi:hypothetical protein